MNLNNNVRSEASCSMWCSCTCRTHCCTNCAALLYILRWSDDIWEPDRDRTALLQTLNQRCLLPLPPPALWPLWRPKERRRRSTLCSRKWRFSGPVSRCWACWCGESITRWVSAPLNVSQRHDGNMCVDQLYGSMADQWPEPGACTCHAAPWWLQGQHQDQSQQPPLQQVQCLSLTFILLLPVICTLFCCSNDWFVCLSLSETAKMPLTVPSCSYQDKQDSNKNGSCLDYSLQFVIM